MGDMFSCSDSTLTQILLSGARPVLGRIVHLSADGRPAVDFPGNERGPLEARTICDPPAAWSLDQLANADVLLLFEQDDPRTPLIAGFPRTRLALPGTSAPDRSAKNPPAEAANPAPPSEAPPVARSMTVAVDGQRVLIEGEREIQLRCGRSSLTLRQDGKIVIKGTHIVSRAEGPHRIKGGSVTIN
jgi:hypothetical protein